MQLIDALLPALNAITESFATLFEAGVDFDPLFKIIAGSIRVVAAVTFSLIKLVDTLVKNTVAGFQIVGKLLRGDLFGAMDIFKTRFSGMIDQAKKDFAELGNIMFGTSEAPNGYGRRTGGVLPPGGDQELTPEQKIEKRNSALSKGLDITLKQTAAFAKMLQGLEDERRLLEAKILGKEKEVALDMKVEEMTRGLTPEIAAGVEQRIRGNAALQDTIDKTKDLGTETDKYKITLDQVKDTLANQMTSAIEGLIDGTKTLGESLSGLLKTFASMFLRSGIGSLVGSIFPSANGNVFAQNGIVPYAKGGYIGRPTMALMGEAGPEAVLPLRRGSNGKLGVESSGGGTSNVTVNVDASGSSVEGDGPNASQLGKAIGAAVQAELIKQKRPGGLLTR